MSWEAMNRKGTMVRSQPNAQEFRRYFYLLSTIAVVGSMDSLFTIVKSREEGRTSSTMGGSRDLQSSNYHRTLTLMKTNYDLFSLALVLVISFLYCVAFLCTLLMTAQDVLIANRNGYPPFSAASTSSSSSYDAEWISAALADSSFSAGLTEWKGLDRVRLICAVLAWLGVGEVAAAWRQRTELLEGDGGLERLGAAELRRLVQKQRVGLERATMALSYLESTTAK
eukprot:gene24454-30805_t